MATSRSRLSADRLEGPTRSSAGASTSDWTAQLAAWSAEFPSSAIPEPTRTRATHHILDTFGAIVAGAVHPIPAMLLGTGDAQGRTSGGTIIGRAGLYRFEDCALVNAVSGHVLDIDDQSYSLMGHASVVVLPAILAAAEEAGVSGREVVDAFVIGVEVACKLGEALNPTHFRAGWHTTATVGAFGAAAACARIWKRPSQDVANAFGLVPIMAGGLRANNGTGAKSFQAGQAAQAGIKAVNLTRAGLDATHRVLEAQDGFVSTANAGSFDPSVLARLGDPFDLDSPGVMIKRYPCCSGLGAAIDAVKELRSGAPIDLAAIVRIECRVTPLAYRSLPYRIPQSGLQGKFSAPFTLAAAFIDGDVTNDTYRDDRTVDPDTRRLAELVELTCDETGGFAPSTGPEGAIVSITTGDGAVRTAIVPQPIGGPARPVDWDTLLDKFRTCAEPVVGSRWRDLADRLKCPDTVENFRDFLRMAVAK